MVTFVIAAIVGVVIGLLSGLLGVGGGMIMVPVFRLVLGLPPLVATATSLFTIIPTSVSGAVTRIRSKTCLAGLGVALGVGGACASPLGVYLAQLSPGWAVMLAVAAVLVYSMYTTLKKALATPKTPKGDQGDSASSNDAPDASSDMPEISYTPATIAKAFVIGVIAGVISGYVGVGGGFIMVPLMTVLFNMSMRYASGTSLVAVMILAIPGTVVQCLYGNVDYLIGIAIACGSIPGAYAGARLASRVSERGLRFGFAAFLGVAAILLVVKEFGLLG